MQVDICDYIDGTQKPMCSSVEAASLIGRRPKDILRTIESIGGTTAKGRFVLSGYKDQHGENRPMYLMNVDGFMFLALNLTGEGSARLKEACIMNWDRLARFYAQETIGGDPP